MKTYLDCIPCFMEQALRVGRLSTENEGEIKEILDNVGDMIKDLPMESSPPEISMRVYDKIKQVTGNEDPFEDVKIDHIKKAQKLYPHMKDILEESDDSLLDAVKLSIAGNIIDLGVSKTFNIEEDILKSLHLELTIKDFEDFKNKINTSKNILYLGDNSGEAVFDKLLIEEIGKPIDFAVREKPIINDITKKEAEMIKMDEVADIISSGTSAPGTVLNTCNAEFIDVFEKADVIISKGQGNYESLSGTDYPIFFLLKAKCDVIARDIGVPEDSLILMNNAKKS
ncbi:MAG: ARMT1-like domain-containing protein [Candidatus Marinimicrobia bacterium]|nr:ARMT1-like domain-containing protein [Candidatus Neomarinimicrobiota bacterium]